LKKQNSGWSFLQFFPNLVNPLKLKSDLNPHHFEGLNLLYRWPEKCALICYTLISSVLNFCGKPHFWKITTKECYVMLGILFPHQTFPMLLFIFYHDKIFACGFCGGCLVTLLPEVWWKMHVNVPENLASFLTVIDFVPHLLDITKLELIIYTSVQLLWNISQKILWLVHVHVRVRNMALFHL